MKAGDTAEVERVVEALKERLEAHDISRKEVQEELRKICEKQRKDIDEQEKEASGSIEESFAKKVNSLQEALKCTPEGSDGAYREIDRLDEKRKAAHENNEATHDGLRKMVNENERDVNRSLEEQFKNEDSRLQAALHSLQTVAEATSDKSRVSEALQKARAELVAVVQRYSIREVESTKNESE